MPSGGFPGSRPARGLFADEDESLQFPDMINRGIEVVAQRRGFDLLVRSVDVGDHDPGKRILSLARKSDGLILHDRILEPDQLARLSRQVPIVTLAGMPTGTTVNVRSDNKAGMTELAAHLVRDHGYGSVGYLAGHTDSPDNLTRQERARRRGDRRRARRFADGPQWRGNYLAVGGASVVDPADRPARDAAAGDRLRERPDGARRDVRAVGPRHRRARRGRGHRV